MTAFRSGSARARTKARCPADARIDHAGLVHGPAIPGDAHPAPGRLGCELVAGHEGGHAALVATTHDGDQWWWLRWDERPGTVVQIDPCGAELPQGRYADDCFLPDGHPGPHSYELRPLAPTRMRCSHGAIRR